MPHIRLILIFTLLSCCFAGPSQAVENGKDAINTAVVLKLSVQFNDTTTGILKQHNCSGTLITPNVLATDAHCLYVPEIGGVQTDLNKVLVGWANKPSTEGEVVKEIDINPSYNYQGHAVSANDIAFIILSTPRDFNSHIQVASEIYSQQLVNSNAEVTAYGYGYTDDAGTILPDFPFSFTGNLLWSGGQSSADVHSNDGHACGGDSGGPVISNSNGTLFILGLISGVSSMRQNCGGISRSGDYSTQFILLNQFADLQQKVVQNANNLLSTQQHQINQGIVPDKKTTLSTCVHGRKKLPQKMGKCPKGYIFKS